MRPGTYQAALRGGTYQAALRGGTYQAAQSITHPGEDVTIEPDDAVLLVVRGSRLAVGALFSMPATRIRSGRGA